MIALKLVFLVLMLSDCNHSTKAMGLCKFARTFPCNETKCPLSSQLPGCQWQVHDKRKIPIQQTTKQSATNHSTPECTSRPTYASLFPQATTEKASSVHVTSANVTTNPRTAGQVTKAGQVTIANVTPDHVMTGHVTTDNAINTTSLCPPNMVYANCTTCQGTCGDPEGCISNCTEPETCVCYDGFLLNGDDCVPEEECECFIEGEGVIPAHGTYVDGNCSKRCVCTDGLLNCNADYKCSLNATCRRKDGVRQCYCNEGYTGDGETCLYTDCYGAYQAGHREDGIYTILPSGWQGTPFNVFCDMANAGGGWTIFQRRVDGITNFTRNWKSYKHGFGSLDEGKDFWLGNEQLFYLTNQRDCKLRIDITNSYGIPYFAEYSYFRIGNESSNYRVFDIGTHIGNTDNGMEDMNGVVFSTYDQDNDECDKFNCAERHGSGWWHNPNYKSLCSYCHPNASCRNFEIAPNCYTVCTVSNLNGIYNGNNGQNLNWLRAHICNAIVVEMKIRPDLA